MNLINQWLRRKFNYNLLKNMCISVNIFITVMIVSFLSCESNPDEHTLWVNSAKVDCVGVGPMQCFQIKSNENEPWTNLYQEISGFDFEPGFIYKLHVAIDTLDKTNLPADKSYLEYSLIEVISKQRDPYLLLNDIWVVTKIHGIEDLSITSSQLAGIEINTRSMNILGSDGCNNYRGKIETLSGNKLLFGPIMGTKKACPDMSIPNKFTSSLKEVRYYKREGLSLILYDENDLELLTFKKID